jgi:HAD superfamily hydrolase (TIGR01509 family)
MIDDSSPTRRWAFLYKKEVTLIPGIIFDMDGVIIDSEPLHHRAERALLSQYNISITDEALHAFAGKDATQLLNGFIKQYHLSVDFQVLYRQHQENVERVFHNADIPATPAVELIQKIHRKKMPLALASSSHRRLIQLVLDRLSLGEFFQVVIGGDEIQRGKPFPDIYIESAKRLKKDPAFCMAIEDSKNGVQSAKDAGCFCVGYVNPNSGNQDLRRADKIVHDFTNLNVETLLEWMKVAI